MRFFILFHFLWNFHVCMNIKRAVGFSSMFWRFNTITLFYFLFRLESKFNDSFVLAVPAATHLSTGGSPSSTNLSWSGPKLKSVNRRNSENLPSVFGIRYHTKTMCNISTVSLIFLQFSGTQTNVCSVSGTLAIKKIYCCWLNRKIEASKIHIYQFKHVSFLSFNNITH